MGARLREAQAGRGGGSPSGPNSDFELKGFEQFAYQVSQIPDKYQRAEVLKVLRKCTSPTIRAIRSQVIKHDNSGNLWQSVGNITGKSKTFPNILVGFRVRNGYKGFHGHILEHGTQERFRRKKRTSAFGVVRNGKNISTGKMPALNLVKKGANASESQAIAEAERQMLAFTEKQLKKIFR